MNIDSDKAAALYQLSIDKTFSRAAKSLGISQPALSKKIARLEDDLSTNLVIRHSRGINFTDSGLELLKYYKHKKDLDLELLNKISSDNKYDFTGEISIATYSSIGRSVVLPSLSLLLKDFSNLKINFLIKEIRDLEEALISGECNFILTNQMINRNGVINKEVGIEENVRIASKSSKASTLFLDHDKYDQTTLDFLRLQGDRNSFKRSYFDDVYTIIEAVKLGFGQAVVSHHLVKNCPGIKIQESKKKMISPIFLAYFDREYFPLVHRKVITVLTESIETHLKGASS